MLAIILKDLRCYANSRKYRRIQFIVLCVHSRLCSLWRQIEFYAHRRMVGTVDVGKQTYMLFIIAFFVVQFFVPRHIVEALYMERGHLKDPRTERCSACVEHL